MGIKEIAQMLTGAAALMPEINAPKKKKNYVHYGFTPKQWERRKKKLKQQKLSRKINRQKVH